MIKRVPRILDLAFVMDCTGSMGSYIETSKQQIMNIAKMISEKEEIQKIRFALICYRDHEPQDKTYITRVFDFTEDLSTMQDYVNTANAQGGGDLPEAVADGLHELLNISWFSDAVKISIFIADAPPHGLKQGDTWSGCPSGHDPIKIARECAKRGIIVYSVACEPAVSNNPPTGDFMKAIAEITEGRYVPLSGAHLLPKIIMGAADEEADLEALIKEVKQQVENLGGIEEMAEEEIVNRIHSKLKKKGIMTAQMDIDERETSKVKYSAHYTSAKDLRSAVEDYTEEMKKYMKGRGIEVPKLTKALSMSRKSVKHGRVEKSLEMESEGFRVSPALLRESSPPPQEIAVSKKEISSEQVKRMLGRVKKRKKG